MGAGGSTSSKGSNRAALVDVATALSLANLCYLPAWYAAIRVSLNPEAQWSGYSRNACIAAIAGVLLLAGVIWLAARSAQHRRSRTVLALRDAIFLTVCLQVAMAIAQGESPAAVRLVDDALGPARAPIALLSLAIAALLIRSPWRRQLVGAGRTAVLLLAPFVLFTLGQALWLLPQFGVPDPAPLVESAVPGPPRVIWVVFDELDQRLAFDARPADLQLPELDRLRATAVVAERAYPPADATLLSIPALLIGRVVTSSNPAGPSDRILELTGEGNTEESTAWSETENVFRRARLRGVNSGLTGWYHPYDRILGSDLVLSFNRDPRDASLVVAMLAQVQRVLATPPLGWLVDVLPDALSRRSSRHRQHVRRHRDILADAIAMASDPRLGLVFVHASIPHLPVIYDRHRGTYVSAGSGSYFDNLALVDRSIDELRRSMEAAGTWDATALIITSDHALKPKRLHDKLPGHLISTLSQHHRRVPFVLKMPYQRSGIVVATAWNTVATEGLILAILDGTVTDAAAATAWMDAQALP